MLDRYEKSYGDFYTHKTLNYGDFLAIIGIIGFMVLFYLEITGRI